MREPQLRYQPTKMKKWGVRAQRGAGRRTFTRFRSPPGPAHNPATWGRSRPPRRPHPSPCPPQARPGPAPIRPRPGRPRPPCLLPPQGAFLSVAPRGPPSSSLVEVPRLRPARRSPVRALVSAPRLRCLSWSRGCGRCGRRGQGTCGESATANLRARPGGLARVRADGRGEAAWRAEDRGREPGAGRRSWRRPHHDRPRVPHLRRH